MTIGRKPHFDIAKPLAPLHNNPDMAQRLAEAAIGDSADPEAGVAEHIDSAALTVARLAEEAATSDEAQRSLNGLREHFHTIAWNRTEFPAGQGSAVVDAMQRALVFRGKKLQ